jgi:hypothetical protein
MNYSHVIDGLFGNNNVENKRFYWWTVGDSNPRLPRCERGALPAELTALNSRELLATSIEKEKYKNA